MNKYGIIALFSAFTLILSGCGESKKTDNQSYKGNFEIVDENGTVIVNTDNLKSVSIVEDENANRCVKITFDEIGKEKFAEATGNNIFKILYVYVDGNLVSSPTVRDKITSGEATISGSETDFDADAIVNDIKNGSEHPGERIDVVKNTQETIVTPSGFKKISNADFEKVPNNEDIESALRTALDEIKVAEIKGIIYGNYKSISTDVKDIEAYVVTDKTKLIAKLERLYVKWKVTIIKDYESNAMYYPTTGRNAVSYESGEVINEEETKESKENVPHREGMFGISDKDIFDIGGPSVFARNDVRNDVTGKWKVSTINKNFDIPYYALSYYNKYIHNDNEIHAIVNFNDNTTTCISCQSGNLYVTVHKYVKGEEHNAKIMFSGAVIKDYIIYTDNGDIELISE